MAYFSSAVMNRSPDPDPALFALFQKEWKVQSTDFLDLSHTYLQLPRIFPFHAEKIFDAELHAELGPNSMKHFGIF